MPVAVAVFNSIAVSMEDMDMKLSRKLPSKQPRWLAGLVMMVGHSRLSPEELVLVGMDDERRSKPQFILEEDM